MPVKSFKPTTPGRRGMSVSTFEEITRSRPHKPLVKKLKRTAGRNAYGRVSVRHRGGGHKRRYRVIDFKRNKYGVPARVESIEYDPNRSARIALLSYADGERRYILAPDGIEAGDVLESGPDADIRSGNALPLKRIPAGTIVHNVELRRGKGGQLVRSAGSWAQLMAKEGGRAHLRLPSGEVRLVDVDCMATVGQVSNVDHENVKIGKAGRNRWRGRRPATRGVAMNPVDHPHGGGEGKAPVGRHPVTPWGKPAGGKKTRKRHKKSDRSVVKRRR